MDSINYVDVIAVRKMSSLLKMDSNSIVFEN